MKPSLLSVSVVLATGCGPAPALEFWVDGFVPRGDVGVAHLSVLASEGQDVGQGQVTLVEEGAVVEAPLIHGRARFEVSCASDGTMCAEPVRLEARWNGVVAHYAGRLSRTAGEPGPFTGARSRKPPEAPDTAPGEGLDAGNAVLPTEEAADAGARWSNGVTSTGRPRPPPPAPDPWHVAFHQGVDVEFVVTSSTRLEPGETPGGGVSLEEPMSGGFLHCNFDLAGRCTLRGVRPGPYSGSICVWYASGNGSAAVCKGFEVTVPWYRSRMTVPLGAPW